MFSEIARRFIDNSNKQVAIITHRQELCRQTSNTLKSFGVENAVITSTTRSLPKRDTSCYVAMAQTLRNRIREKRIYPEHVGLVIIDEAHYNGFRKLLKRFPYAIVIGVTATPFSSDTEKPLRKYYKTLVSGENIASLIAGGFLAKPQLIVHKIELNTLKTGINGDYTVKSSNELYGSPAMLDLLLTSYRENTNGKKTLIFNNGIESSLMVYETFKAHGIPVRHLDNRTSNEDRKEILLWFKKTKNAVLTSVSILTTGFDEPSVKTIILFRATTSITLFHQMVGRGSRALPSKKTFNIIDFGNNSTRFGKWEDPVDWQFAFEHPKAFAQSIQFNGGGGSSVNSHGIAAELRTLFPKTLELSFDIEGAYEDAEENGEKPKSVLRASIRQQALMCIDNADSISDALALAEALRPEIEWRVKQYVKCLQKATPSYKEWLTADYFERLSRLIRKAFLKLKPAA